MELKKITKSIDNIYEIKKLYFDSFPNNEKLPFWYLLHKSKSNGIDFIAIYDDEIFIGFAFLINSNDLIFILYFAIDDKYRGNGYGSKALSAIRNRYSNNRIILNIEAIDETAQNYEQRKRRKRFYEKNGYKEAGILLYDHNDLYQMLIIGEGITIEEYRLLLKKFTGTILSWFFSPKLFLS